MRDAREQPSGSPAIHLVAYRVLARIGCTTANIAANVDAITGGFVKLHADTVPFLVWVPTATTTMQVQGQFIQTIERRQGLKVAAPEEIVWRNGWVDDAQLERLARPLAKSGYGEYLLGLLREKALR